MRLWHVLLLMILMGLTACDGGASIKTQDGSVDPLPEAGPIEAGSPMDAGLADGGPDADTPPGSGVLTATVVVGRTVVVNRLAENFAGLSYEADTLGQTYFTPTNTTLVSLF